MNGLPAAALESLRQIDELRQRGRLAAAPALCEALLRRHEWTFEALHALAISLAREALPGAALIMFDRALEIGPGNAAAHCNRGATFQGLGRLDDALADYDRAIALRPEYALAHGNRGNVLALLERPSEALAAYDMAISLMPEFAMAHVGRGNVLLDLRRWEGALTSYDRAVAISPQLAPSHANRGVALAALGRLAEARASLDAAIALRPQHAEAYVARGAVCKEQNRLQAALTDYERAIALRSDYAEAYVGRGIISLLAGNLLDGWRDFEWRKRLTRRVGEPALHEYRQPIWLGGGSIAGSTLLLHSEKGLGDTVQFSRYVTLLAHAGVRVLLRVQAPLVGVLSSLEGVDTVAAEEHALPNFDYHCPLLSLPLAFRTTVRTIPATHPYLHADPNRVARWRVRLVERGSPRVGLVWRGDPMNPDDRNRSIALEAFARLLPAGIRCVSLQRQLNETEKSVFAAQRSWVSACDALDLDETAALCECLELVISVDTSVAHLSAALGRPTWILLPFSPDCRWLLGRDDSPWYPTARLFRQQAVGGWDGVLGRVATALRARFGETGNLDSG